jgi:hypothetical protein
MLIIIYFLKQSISLTCCGLSAHLKVPNPSRFLCAYIELPTITVTTRSQIAAMAQANPPPVIPPPPVVPPQRVPIFSLTPAELHTAAFVDLGSTEGRKMFSTATKPLEEPFDGAKTGIHMFIHQVTTRASINGWNNTIMTIPTPTVADPLASMSLLTQFGQVTLAHIEAHALTYQGTPTKAAQDALALKLFLDGSLNKTLMLRVLAKKSSYTFGGIENGPAMFRIILQLVGIETTASIAVINAILRTMPSKMDELNSDIVKFNEFVTEQCNELNSRGQPPHDILHLLFEAYLTASNNEFKEYIRAKESAVYDGTMIIDYQDLMSVAEEKYKIMTIKGQWKHHKKTTAPTADEHIVALQAQVEALQAMQSKPTNYKQSSKASAGGPTTTDRRNNTGKWAWKDKAPKGTEPKVKTFEGRVYVHCPNHESTKWVLADKHKDGCKLDPKWKYPGGTSQATTTGTSTGGPDQQLTYANALMHVIDESADENI